MKTRWLMIVAGITACASTDALLEESPDVASAVPDASPPPDADSDAAVPEFDAGPCVDCEYFPEVCTPDALCSSELFDPNQPGESLDLRTQIMVIRGRSASDVWAAGALGALAHFDGSSWKRSDPGERETLRALWLRDSGEVALGVLDHVFARGLDDAGAPPSAGGWTRQVSSATLAYNPSPWVPLPLVARSLKFQSAWAAPGSESLWCATLATNAGSSSGLWRLRQTPSSTFEIGVGIAPEVCRVLPCSQMTSIHGASANELWAVGAEGSTVRITDAESDTPNVEVFNSQTWNALHGVWAASASEAWSVGVRGTIRRYTGDPEFWDVVSDVPTTENLNAVWGSSATDIWAVGDRGVVLHYDGKSWSRVKVAGLGVRRPTLSTVWLAGTGHVWVGGQGVLLSLGGNP
ncbi:MAG: hypothetical protein J0I07_20000 [Myxococcales bacterium]|nr:hypothetical protein [Myxococcales bacterium]